MCGIFGLVSSENVVPALLEGLTRLEYRGYDSCGIAVSTAKSIEIRKDKGDVKAATKTAGLSDLVGTLGIGHTRWATHGPPTQANSHPHPSTEFAIVHNGIIENYSSLKASLSEYVFVSDTDTEVIAHLLSRSYSQTNDVQDAIYKTLSQLEGTFALAIVSTYQPGTLYAIRREQPLIVGINSDTAYRAIASDTQAFSTAASKIVYIEDEELVILTKDGYQIVDSQGKEIWKTPESFKQTVETGLEGYPDYMSKEIGENAKVVEAALLIRPEDIAKAARIINSKSTTYFTGMGTAHYVATMAQYLFAEIVGKYFPAISADELHCLSGGFSSDDVIVAVSQSGETYDTLKPLRAAKEKGATTIAITNVPTSSMAREVDLCIEQGAGPEICVLSTKSTVSQLVIMLRIAIETSNKLTSIEKQEYNKTLKELPKKLQQMLDAPREQIIEIARKHARVKNWFFLGREFYSGLAAEAALKFKEVTYHHAEGMSAGMLKHGVISLIEPSVNTIMFMPSIQEQELRAQCLGAAQEIKAREGMIIAIQPEGAGNPEGLFDDIIEYPQADALTTVFFALTIAQLYAYYTAKALGRNIDRPRALAKSVTVG